MSTSVAATPFVEAQLDAAAQRTLPGSGLAWLDQVRRENLAAFAATGLPSSRVEAWKYTALRAFAQKRFGLVDPAAPAPTVDSALASLPGIDGPRLVFVNGVFRAELSMLDALPAGLSLQPLAQALATQPDPLRFALSRHYQAAGDAFAQLNAALAGDGVVLRVAAGAKIAAPVQLVFIGAPAEMALAWHARNLIEVGQGAELLLVERHLGSAENAHLGNLVSDVTLQENARLTHVVLQSAASGSSLIRRSQLSLQRQAEAALYVLELGGALVRHDLTADLLGDGARLDTRGVFALRGRQHVDTQLVVHHRAKHTASDALWRGVADERSRGVFRGAIVVAEGADGTDAALSNKNLLLSAGAEIDSKPELEIYADEVKAAHGATVGQLDERALFYLRSRGIAQAEARSLLTAAFCRAVIDTLPHEGLRDHLSAQLLAHLPHRNEA